MNSFVLQWKKAREMYFNGVNVFKKNKPKKENGFNRQIKNL